MLALTFTAAVLGVAIAALCKLVFGLVALRGVKPKDRAEVVLAVGEAWAKWGVATLWQLTRR